MKLKTISSVLIAANVLTVAVIIAGLVWYVSNSSKDMAMGLARQSMEQAADTVTQSLDDYVEGAQDMARVLAVQAALVDALENGETSRADQRLSVYVKNYDEYWAMLLFDATGKVVAGYTAQGANLAGQQRAGAPYVQAIVQGQPHYLSTDVIAADGQADVLVFPVSHAIKSASGKVLGGVAVLPRWKQFTERHIQPMRFGERGYGFILDSKGTLLAHAMDPKLVGQSIAQHEFVQQALTQKDGAMDYPWQGEDKFMAFHTDPETGWMVAMSAYHGEMSAVAVQQRNVLVGVGLAALILLAVITTLLMRRLVGQPLARVGEYTTRIAQGDMAATLEGRFRYELATLAANLRVMVGELKNKLGFSQGILDGMTTPALVVDPDVHISFANQAALDFLGHGGKPEDFIGQKAGEFFYGDPNRTTNTEKVIRERKAITGLQISLNSRKGNEVFCQLDTAPLFDLDGKMLGAFVLFTDLTEIKHQQQRIEAQNERIAQVAVQALEIADQVASASEELSAQVEQSSQGADEQRNRTSEAATAMEEMNATVLEVAKSASGAAEQADLARQQAQGGADLVNDVVRVIGQVNEKAEELKRDMTEMGHQAEDIGRVMGVIADIADQTNLLALNAAIEAARAGDAGRGFAVVADEVRKLAEKTMAATGEVARAIQAVQASAKRNVDSTEAAGHAVGEATERAQASGRALEGIVVLVEETSDQVRSIATASEEQASASEEVTRATEEVNRIASETADAMRQSAQAVGELARLSQTLRTLMEGMRDQG